MLWIALLPAPPAPVHTDDRAMHAQATALAGQALAWQALACTPRVTLLDEAVLLEVSASLRLFRGLPALLRMLPPGLPWASAATALQALARLRVCQSSLRNTPHSTSLPTARLPLHTLGAAREHLDALEHMGCRTWGDLRGLPRAGVARRFGQGLLDALDRAEGRLPEVHAWVTVPAVFDQQLELPALVEDAPALMFSARRLLAQLAIWLHARHAGVLELELVWRLDRRRTVARDGRLLLRTARATQDVDHLASLATAHLERTTLPAPAHALRLRTLRTGPMPHESAPLLPDDRLAGANSGEPLYQLVERLQARLGAAQVLRWQPRDDHRPEHMQTWTPAGVAATALAAPPADHALLPSWLLPSPRPLAVRHDRPCLNGEPLSLRLGPQRLETSAWASAGAPGDAHDSVQRDYFIAHSARHGLLWIYRERLPGPGRTPRWCLHGLFG